MGKENNSEGSSAEDVDKKMVINMTIQRKRINLVPHHCVVCDAKTYTVLWNKKDDKWYECCCNQCLVKI